MAFKASWKALKFQTLVLNQILFQSPLHPYIAYGGLFSRVSFKVLTQKVFWFWILKSRFLFPPFPPSHFRATTVGFGSFLESSQLIIFELLISSKNSKRRKKSCGKKAVSSTASLPCSVSLSLPAELHTWCIIYRRRLEKSMCKNRKGTDGR